MATFMFCMTEALTPSNSAIYSNVNYGPSDQTTRGQKVASTVIHQHPQKTAQQNSFSNINLKELFDQKKSAMWRNLKQKTMSTLLLDKFD